MHILCSPWCHICICFRIKIIQLYLTEKKIDVPRRCILFSLWFHIILGTLQHYVWGYIDIDQLEKLRIKNFLPNHRFLLYRLLVCAHWLLYYCFSTSGICMPVSFHWKSFIYLGIIRGKGELEVGSGKGDRSKRQKTNGSFCFEALEKRREVVGKETWASELASFICGEKGDELCERRHAFWTYQSISKFQIVLCLWTMLGSAFNKMWISDD